MKHFLVFILFGSLSFSAMASDRNYFEYRGSQAHTNYHHDEYHHAARHRAERRRAERHRANHYRAPRQYYTQHYTIVQESIEVLPGFNIIFNVPYYSVGFLHHD